MAAVVLGGFKQAPAGGLHNAALNLVDHAVRVDDQTHVHGRPGFLYRDHARARVHRDVHDDGHIRRQVFVLGEGDAPAL